MRRLPPFRSRGIRIPRHSPLSKTFSGNHYFCSSAQRLLADPPLAQVIWNKRGPFYSSPNNSSKAPALTVCRYPQHGEQSSVQLSHKNFGCLYHPQIRSMFLETLAEVTPTPFCPPLRFRSACPVPFEARSRLSTPLALFLALLW